MNDLDYAIFTWFFRNVYESKQKTLSSLKSIFQKLIGNIITNTISGNKVFGLEPTEPHSLVPSPLTCVDIKREHISMSKGQWWPLERYETSISQRIRLVTQMFSQTVRSTLAELNELKTMH